MRKLKEIWLGQDVINRIILVSGILACIWCLVKGQGRPVALGVEGQGTVFFNQRPCRRLHRISAIPTRRRLVFRS